MFTARTMNTHAIRTENREGRVPASTTRILKSEPEQIALMRIESPKFLTNRHAPKSRSRHQRVASHRCRSPRTASKHASILEHTKSRAKRRTALTSCARAPRGRGTPWRPRRRR
uniref:Uncharacterized protein n=1 Tax=Arundo donax TaxID=35708 RepID=A0A0A9A4S2_ARUDO